MQRGTAGVPPLRGKIASRYVHQVAYITDFLLDTRTTPPQGQFQHTHPYPYSFSLNYSVPPDSVIGFVDHQNRALLLCSPDLHTRTAVTSRDIVPRSPDGGHESPTRSPRRGRLKCRLAWHCSFRSKYPSMWCSQTCSGRFYGEPDYHDVGTFATLGAEDVIT